MVPTGRRFTRLLRSATMSGLVGFAFSSLGCQAVLGIKEFDEGAQGCTSNSQCISDNNGKDAVCHASSPGATPACVVLANADCSVSKVGASGISNEDVLLLGAVLPLSGGAMSAGQAFQASIEVGLTDFVTAGGLPTGTSGGSRPIALVVCDEYLGDKDNADGSKLHRSVQHLLDAGIPAFVGPVTSGDTLAVLSDVTTPQALAVSPTATSVLLTGKSDLLWRTCPADDVQGDPLSKLVPVIEKHLRDTKVLATGTSMKVAVAYRNDSYGQALFNSVQATVSFNSGASSSGDSANFLPAQYTPPTSTDFGNASTIVSLTDFAPNLILLFGNDETISGVIREVESQWPTTGLPRPFYLGSDGVAGNASTFGTTGLFTAAEIADIQTRMLVTSPGNLNSINAKAFKLNYGNYVMDPHATLSFGMAQSYDALYLLAYGTVASGAAHPTGAQIAAGFAKLVPGASMMTPLAVGLNNISTATLALVNGGSIDLDGASGPLDFDLTKYSASSDIDIECISSDGMMMPTISTPSSGAVYAAASDSLTGTVTCGATTFSVQLEGFEQQHRPTRREWTGYVRAALGKTTAIRWQRACTTSRISGGGSSPRRNRAIESSS